MSTIAHFSLDHYEHMIEVGAFSGEYKKHVELIRGEIVTMNPIGPSHSDVLTLLTDWSYQVVPLAKMAIRGQQPIRIPVSDSEPEPDLIWAIHHDDSKRYYSKRHPEPHEVLLLVEVADSSLEVDRGAKLGVYAEAGIGDYWIVNLIDEQIEVYRNPAGRSYQEKTIFRGDTPLQPLALSTATIQPSRLFS
ncbi:MAG: Uma2 family endonuclease [Planctomycetia bacterium]|nr:Uma2 family endonuclease [Planctomycetia bacterium]